MSAILIQSVSKENEDFIMRLAKILHTPVKLLNEEEELDALLIESIEKGIKSGKQRKVR